MRTTINLPDELVAAAKRRARQEGRTLTSLLEEAVRLLLARDPADTTPAALPTWGSPEGRALVRHPVTGMSPPEFFDPAHLGSVLRPA